MNIWYIMRAHRISTDTHYYWENKNRADPLMAQVDMPNRIDVSDLEHPVSLGTMYR